ncbi:hypothetical protein [Thalassoroseus pseudoceratinae]|uniref:hypothetical protein n=1 Tax=Thalassoroseus pseudoceratinae TaxID=2713176 RepID=UPI00142316F9|nr:hypothetical protein [Thalassoroseus pseudoceratinae]
MFERRLIFQEGDASLWILVTIVIAAVGVIGLATNATKKQRRWLPLILFSGLTIFAVGKLAWSSLGAWAVGSILAVLAAVGLIFVLLQYERRLVRPSVGNTLLLLRLAILFVFAVTLLKPSLVWERIESHDGRILVAIDLSDSMDTLDSHATSAEKLRWARGLGMIGNSQIDQRLDEYLEAFEKGQEPEWVGPDEVETIEERRELTQVRRENLNAVFESVDRLSRKAVVQRLLFEDETPLWSAIGEAGERELIVFAGQSEMLAALDDEQTADFIEQTSLEPPDKIQAETTDLSQGLRSLNGDSEKPLIGVVLLTDGRDQSDGNAVELAARLGNVSSPVFPVMIGSERRPRDLAIAHIDYPQTSYPNDTRVVKALLSTSGFEGQSIVVTLEQDGQEPLKQTIIPTSDEADIQFEIDEDEIGRHELTLKIEPQETETRTDNNLQTFAMTIVDDQVRIILLDGVARWEFRYIHNAYIRDEAVGRDNVDAIVFDQPYLGVLPDTWFPRKLNLPRDANDQTQSPFADADLVILGDVAPANLPPNAWELLDRFVSEDAGTLVLTAGQRHFPMQHRSPIVERLLPIENPQPHVVAGANSFGSPHERGFHLRLTPEAEREAMFQLSTDGAAANQSVWKNLPGHTWGIFGEAKPQAMVYAVADVNPANRPVGHTLTEERNNAMIVQQYVGAGQVLWLGIDSTWRWRSRVGDAYHHRFWGQLARWAAMNKAVAGNDFVRFGMLRTDLNAGEDAVFQARWRANFLRQNPDVTATAVIEQKDARGRWSSMTEVDLSPITDGSLMHEGQAANLPAGEYRVNLRVAGAAVDPGNLETKFYVTERPTAELTNVSANRKLLQQIADVSGGELFTPDTVSRLPERLTPPDIRSSRREEFELWDHWPVLILFFVLLTGEWLVRKLNGLP